MRLSHFVSPVEHAEFPLAELLGKAFGSYVAEHEGGGEIAVGRDNRASGPELQSALIRGLVSTGATVYVTPQS